MLSSTFFRSICRADVDGFDHLADEALNKKLLLDLMVSAFCVSKSDDGMIWHHEASGAGVFYFMARKADTICLYIPYREVDLVPGLSAVEVRSWQSTLHGGVGRGWKAARDEIFGMLLGRSQLVISSDSVNRSGGRFWEDRVGQHILAGGRGGIVRDGVLAYRDDYLWFAPMDVGRDGGSRFFIQSGIG